MKKSNKAPRRAPVDSNWLRHTFSHLNAYFFDNRIPASLTVEFKKSCTHKDSKGNWMHADAYFDRSSDSIFLESGLGMFPDLATITLLHEMVHADLRFQGYEGYPVDKGHGTRFQGEIVRLIKAGGYDGLL